MSLQSVQNLLTYKPKASSKENQRNSKATKWTQQLMWSQSGPSLSLAHRDMANNRRGIEKQQLCHLSVTILLPSDKIRLAESRLHSRWELRARALSRYKRRGNNNNSTCACGRAGGGSVVRHQHYPGIRYDP
jgi:hypothetical protein